MRKVQFANGEYYHVYNRGVDHRQITSDQYDSDRFVNSLRIFNTATPLGGLYEAAFSDHSKILKFKDPLVEIVSYCLNPNHFHLCLKQCRKNGVSEFLKNLSGGYSRYFNSKNKRTGALFEGKFKAKHVSDNDYLLHLSCYINLNDRVHGLDGDLTSLVRTSWDEYIIGKSGICNPKFILDQFDADGYKKFALDGLPYMKSLRGTYEELKKLSFD